jgi:hypothetical protein
MHYARFPFAHQVDELDALVRGLDLMLRVCPDEVYKIPFPSSTLYFRRPPTRACFPVL